MTRTSLTAAVLALALAGCGEDLPTGDPAKSTQMGQFGETLTSEGAIGPRDTKYWFRNLVSDYAELDFKDKPAKVELVNGIYGCKFDPPGAGEKVVLISAKEVPTKAPVFTFTRAEIAQRAEAFVAEWKRQGVDPGTDIENTTDGMRLAEVVVTDTSAPLYLVLGGPAKVLWNFHVAEGVKIARVALIADRDAAVANLPAGVPVNLLGGQQAENCKAIPFRRPTTRWGITERAKSDAAARDALDKRHIAHSNFDRWFEASFVVDSESVGIGADVASNFLVGPPPASLKQRIPYRALAGSHMKMSQPDHFVVGFIADYKAKNDQLVRAHAARLVGGNLASLNRP
jgi:hypothetical protein